MYMAWHGTASFTIDVDGLRITVDPQFSEASEYGPWYVPNLNAPTWDHYLSSFLPHIVLITHAHFDHFDLHTISRFADSTSCLFVASPTIIDTIRSLFAPGEHRLLSINPDSPGTVQDITIVAHTADHWLTGDEGTTAASKLAGRPELYGVMPCGGPAYGYVITGAGTSVYISGDTLAHAVPDIDPDIAVVFIAGTIPHPATGELCTPALTTADLAPLIERLSPRVTVAVHFDSTMFMEQITPEDIHAVSQGRVRVLPYNSWVAL